MGHSEFKKNRGIIKNIARTGARLIANQRGSLVPAVAGGLVVLTGATGLTVDGARMFYVKDVLQKSLDSAGLAAGHALDVDNMENDAREFFNANIAAVDNLAADSDMQVSVSPDNEVITLVATAKVRASFMSVFGVQEITVSATTEITRETRGMELVLVMDNTGSMRHGGKIDTMKEAATNLVNVVYGDKEVNPNLWVGVVPYVAHVNVGKGHTAWLTDAGNTQVDTQYFGTEWMGCVEARPDSEDETDTPPADAGFSPYYFEDTDYYVKTNGSGSYGDNNWINDDTGELTIREWNSRTYARGPNRGCGEPITPLVAEKTKIIDAIDDMAPWSFGGTATPMGLVWGWRVVSPRWRGLWGGSPSHLPVDHNSAFMDKVIVVLTDGKNEFISQDANLGGSDYTAYGRIADMGHTSIYDARDDLDDRFARICSNIKNDGILIYSITFGTTPDTNTRNAFQSCASKQSFYFHAPNATSLEEAFETIGRQLSNLRLSK